MLNKKLQKEQLTIVLFFLKIFTKRYVFKMFIISIIVEDKTVH